MASGPVASRMGHQFAVVRPKRSHAGFVGSSSNEVTVLVGGFTVDASADIEPLWRPLPYTDLITFIHLAVVGQ